MENSMENKTIMMISTHGYVAADPPLGAPDTGGQVVYILELAKKLGLFGYKVDIWTRQFEDQPSEDQVDENVRVVRVPCGNKDFITKEYLYKKIPEWSRNALNRIKKENLDYSFVNSHYWDAGVAGKLISEKLDIPHVHTPHSIGTWKKEQMLTDFPNDANSFEEQYNFTERIHYENRIYHSCDLVIATSPIQTDKIEQEYEIPRKKIRMIPPGYDDNRFFPVGEASRIAARERLGIEGKTVFTVSRLAHNKGFDLLADAFAVTAERMPDARLLLAVGHENRDETEEEIFQDIKRIARERKIEDRIDFTGYISDEDLPDYYRAADLFVLSSRYEPFGMTTVEAMACGTPAVVTVHGGLARVLEYGTTCLLADPLDREDLGITICKALKYRALHRRLSEKGSRLARSTFTWTGIAQQLLGAVDDLTDAFEKVQVKEGEEL